MEGVRIISVSELLQLSRPLTGAASLHFPSSSPPPSKKQKVQLPTEYPIKSPLLFDPNPNPRIFVPLKQPVLLIGTIDLPTDDSDLCGSKNHCFTFSDGSSRVCCAVLDLDLKMIGRRIHVLAWNFVPFKRNAGGVLEVIRCCLSESEVESHQGFIPPIQLCSSSREDCLIARSHAFGALKSVSPVFLVPCATKTRDRPSMDGGDSTGFLAEIITCECDICSESLTVVNLRYPIGKQSCHSFAKPVFVYFRGSNSMWRPALSKLIGKLILVSGLKKKLVIVGGEESYLMFVTTEKTTASLCQLPTEVMPVGRLVSPRKGGLEIYNGMVTGVYMQGMVVELDEKVWLLITDPLLAPQHSLRVGALVTVRNFHLVRPRFSWIRMLLLGTCARTTIVVDSFSLSDIRCHLRIQSQSLLGKFIESLTSSAQFWRKFAGIFSDKDILGSKNEGVAQAYASASLPSNIFQPRHGVFMEFCKHDQCIWRNESNFVPLKLVLPISNLISKCEAIWMSLISQMQNGAEIVGRNDYINQFSCEGRSDGRLIRKIISSEDLGFILMGSLKISPSSERLQLVDATGSIDVVIPDLLLNFDNQSIHEVKDYKLVIEGLPTQLGPSELHFEEPLSCKNIFQHFPFKKKLNQLAVYVQFFLRDSSCLNVPSRPPSCMFSSDDLRRCRGGIFHLLLVTHKFPGVENFQGDINISNSSSRFAEAIFLPYDLILPDEHDYNQPVEAFEDKLKAQSDYVDNRRDPVKGWYKISQHLHVSYRISHTGSKKTSVEKRRSQVPCLITFRRINLEKSSVHCKLCHGNCSALENAFDKQQAQRVLLEFKSDSFSKYQLLRLGAYYLMKCSKEGFLCYTKGCTEYKNYDKTLVICQTTLSSLSFSLGGVMHQSDSPQDHSSGVCYVGADETLLRNMYSNELIFQESPHRMHETSDFHLHFPAEAIGPLKEETAVEDGLVKLLTAPSDVLSVSSCILTMMTKLVRPFGTADPQSSKLPQGNLISVRGNIEDIHVFQWKTRSFPSSENVSSIHQMRVCNICIHLYDDHHTVRIRGTLKCAYPIGMGPGANATFHRVLLTCTSSRWRELTLTPLSVVVINSIKEVNHQYSEGRFIPGSRSTILNEEFFDMVPSGLISRLIQCMGSKLIRFRCRVVAIHILVLEKDKYDFDKQQSLRPYKIPSIKIPVAGFVLDDGSSMCCCWADADRAKTLLRLHETAPQAFTNSYKSSKRIQSNTFRETIGYRLEKMLKKHHRVIIKNCGTLPDSSCLSFTLSDESDEVFSCSDESLLRFLILNACGGSIFNIVGSMMDSNALEWLDDELELQVEMLSMQNVWVREVGHVNSQIEARNMLHELLSR